MKTDSKPQSASKPTYSVDQVLWAKIRGYPWWPAHVTAINPKDDQHQYTVYFFGDTTHAQLGHEKLAKFEKNYAEFEVKARTSKKLARSIAEAEETLKKRGVIYELVKKPKRRMSKVESKLGSDLQSVLDMDVEDVGEGKQGKEGKEGKQKGVAISGSAEKTTTAVMAREIMRNQGEVMEANTEMQRSGRKITMWREMREDGSGLPVVEGVGKRDKKEIKEVKEVKEVKEIKEITKEIKEIKEPKEHKQPKSPKQHKQPKQPKEPKQIKQPKEPKQPRENKKGGNKETQSLIKQIEPPMLKTKSQQDFKKTTDMLPATPIFKQTRSVRQSNQKPKKSKTKQQQKQNPIPAASHTKPSSTSKQPISTQPPKQPLSSNQLMIDRILSLLQNPKDLITYLSSLQITVNNIKQILDCQVVDVLHECKEPVAGELLKKFKTMIIQKYFSEEERFEVVANRKKVSSSNSGNGGNGNSMNSNSHSQTIGSKDSKQEVRRKTVAKIVKFLKEVYGMNEIQLKVMPVEIENLIVKKDGTVGDVYRAYALETLKHLKNKTYSVEQTMQKISNGSLINTR